MIIGQVRIRSSISLDILLFACKWKYHVKRMALPELADVQQYGVQETLFGNCFWALSIRFPYGAKR